MAGILKHYDALFHFLCPSPNSLKRIDVSSFVGAYKIWGIENKEAPLRVVIPLKPSEEGVQHFEIKSFDHTANHYFALAALIALGNYGLKESMILPKPFNDDAHLLTEEQRLELGITRLPLTF
jgi:glutamine synthetase